MSAPVVMLVIPNLGSGGAQKVFRRQLAFYSSKCTTIGVVFNRDGFIDEDRRMDILTLDVPAGRTWPGKFIFFLRRIKRLRAIKRQHGVTVSISHLEGADYVNCLSRVNEKVICWIHGTKTHDRDISGTLGLLRRNILMPYLYRKSHLIVTVSERIAVELKRDFGQGSSRIISI